MKTVSGKSLATVDGRIHVAEGGRDDDLVAILGKLADDALGVGGGFGHVFLVGGFDVGEVFLKFEPALIVRVGPAHIANRTDIDEGDLESAILGGDKRRTVPANQRARRACTEQISSRNHAPHPLGMNTNRSIPADPRSSRSGLAAVGAEADDRAVLHCVALTCRA